MTDEIAASKGRITTSMGEIVAVDAVRCEPFSACIPCSEQTDERGLFSRHRAGPSLGSCVISVACSAISVELIGLLSHFGAVFTVDFREDKLPFAGIGSLSAGARLHSYRISLRE
jgi:hypothetical protein